MAKFYKKTKRHLPFYVNMLFYSYTKQCNYFYFCADAGTGVCTEKGTIGESRCRKAKGLNGEGICRRTAGYRNTYCFPVPKPADRKRGVFMTEKSKGKKLLTWTLALSMTLALPPVGVFAEDGAGGEGSQQTNIVPAAEQHDGSSKGSGAINNETKEPTSTSEEGGQNNETAPPSGTLGTPPPSGEGQNGKDETPTPPVGGGETTKDEGTGEGSTPTVGEGGNNGESESGTTGEVKYAATIVGKEGTTYETLQAAINEAENGDTVVLAKDVTENININKSITLDLNGKTLTGLGDDSVVTITGSDTEVTVTSSAEGKGVITGGNNPSNGGGFSIQDATVSLHNLSITENKAIGDGGGYTGGGGIYTKDANLTLDNVHVYENTADLEEHEAADGGGILSIGGALTIKNNSVIENNTAIDDGGGICASNTLVNIEASVIQDNHSLYGGGLYVTGKNSCTITQNTRIQNNRAEYMTPKQKETEFMVPIGGGIYCGDGLDLTIQNSTVALNIGGEQGGGIVAYSIGELILDHAEITNNNATVGGGIFALCTAAANTHITLRNDSSINKNSATSFGGAIYGAPVLKGIPLSITVESSSIYDNEAANGAGIAIYNQFDKKDATITIKSGGKLYGNKATNGYGGGIYSQGTTITIGESTTNSDSNEEEPITNNNGASIRNNQASVGGGGIYGFNSNIILAEDNALYNNAAQRAGDDLFTFGTNSMISLADATKMSGDKKLASDGEKITGWFYDGYKDGWCSRWGAETENGQKYFDAYVTDETAPVQFGLKAACKPAPPSGGGGGGGGHRPKPKPTVEIPDDDALGLNNTDHFAYIVGYGNGEVQPQNSITRAEVAAIFFRLLEDGIRNENFTHQNDFSDVAADAWYCSSVSTLSRMGIIAGYPDGTFRPNAPITRAEFAAIATRFDNNGDKTPVSFTDIIGHWAEGEITVAANHGWVSGYGDGTFRPQNQITRAETMSLVNRVLKRLPETAADLLPDMITWTDNADTSSWYYLPVQEATNSHYYEFKENSKHEKWTELRETRDWSKLG